MRVSVVIPAHNAAETLAATLDSLVAQTHPDWEAIVVDDGSADRTAAIAGEYVARDPRFRLVSQPQGGESSARNHGVRLARGDALLFLDSDDWIRPRHLERLAGTLGGAPALGAVYCGWAYVLPDGEWIFEERPVLGGDVFEAFAQYCLSVVHTFLVRRELVEKVGAFDASLRTCPDWDLWQRIARTGARFGSIPEVLAAYRVRAGSASRNGRQLFKDGRLVLARGHGEDPRMSALNPVHAQGISRRTLPRAEYELAYACAGYEIGGGRDARALFDGFEAARWPDLDPFDAAACLFRHAMIATGRSRTEWLPFWREIRARAGDFFAVVEERSGTAGLAKAAVSSADQLAVLLGRDTHPGRSFRRWQAAFLLSAGKFSRSHGRKLRDARRHARRFVSRSARKLLKVLDS